MAKKFKNQEGSGAVYGLGLIGALIYFLQNTNGFVEVIAAFIKALLWPGFLVYEVFKFLAK